MFTGIKAISFLRSSKIGLCSMACVPQVCWGDTEGRRSLNRYLGSVATIILLIRASTDLKCFFTWQEHWAFADPHQAKLPGGAASAVPPCAVMEQDEGNAASPIQHKAGDHVFL